MKKFLSVLLCAIALMNLSAVPTLAAGSADDLISIATNEIDYKETGVNYTKYGDWYGINPGA